MLWWLLACDDGPAPGRERHADLLARIEAGELHVDCNPIEQPELRADCVWAAVSAGAPPARCDDLDALAADECWFLAAEAAHEVELCVHAGRFERDCRMHALSAALRGLPDDWLAAEAAAAMHIRETGLSADPDAWHAVYRGLLARQRPLTAEPCATARSPAACLRSAQGLLHDRLNRSRDQGEALCEAPLPPAVAFVPHPTLDEVLSARRATDLCSGLRNAPPLEAP